MHLKREHNVSARAQEVFSFFNLYLCAALTSCLLEHHHHIHALHCHTRKLPSATTLWPPGNSTTPHVHQDQDLAQGHDSGVSNHRRSAAFSLYLSRKVQEWNTWSGFIFQLPLSAIKTFSHFYTLRHLHEQNTQVPEVSPVVRLPSRTPATCWSDV